jgi:hypothetical protein
MKRYGFVFGILITITVALCMAQTYIVDTGQSWRLTGAVLKTGFIEGDTIYGVLESGGTPQGLYETSTTKNYPIGTRRVTSDGRVYRYAFAPSTIPSCKFGVKFWTLQSEGIETTLGQAQSIGDTTILIASTAAADYFKGGYVMIHVASGLHQQFRGIVGNTATSGGNITITLDAPLTVAVTNEYTEVYPNPYANVHAGYGVGGHPVGSFSSVAGMPNVITTAVNTYLWIQTWGPIFINPYGATGSDAAADCREVVFDHEGAIAYQFAAKGFVADTTDQHQHAGFVINRQLDAAGNTGPPLIMLQISP